MKSLRTVTPKSNRSGFTLLELLIVLGIIVAIAAMVAPNLMSSRTDANKDIARATIKTLEDAFKRKALKNNGVYPQGSGAEPIRELSQPWTDSSGNEQPPLMEETPMDPWNQEFQYALEDGAMKPKIWSFGPDGQDAGGSLQSDDVSNVRRDIQ